MGLRLDRRGLLPRPPRAERWQNVLPSGGRALSRRSTGSRARRRGVAGGAGEYKGVGIGAGIAGRGGRGWLGSRGDELISDRFPEIRDAAGRLPEGTVLDGEVLAWRESVLPFSVLQRRIGRQELT